jgi:hypothetical protein
MKNKPASLQKPFRNRIVGHGEEDVDQLLANPLNFRLHPDFQQEALAGAIDGIGFIRSLTVNKLSGMVVDGHLRVTLAARSNVKSLPVEYVELTPEEERQALLSLDPISAMAAVDREKLDALRLQVQSQTDDPRVQAMIADIIEREKLLVNNKLQGKPNPRDLPLDAIFTLEDWYSSYVPIAIGCGFLWGARSGPHVLDEKYGGHYKLSFMDNEYTDYNHEIHLACVKKFRPKYATVRDVMTEEQCIKAGIEHFSLEQILDWAEELSQFAENVIVIPKYEEALESIPDKFMLGFSIPTSHGGTMLPVEMFKGRRVHLLGGSWKAQLAHLALLKEDVVSLDNNYVMKTAQYSEIINPEGDSIGNVTSIGLGFTINPLVIAFAIQLGAIGAKLNELYPKEKQSAS